MSDFRIVQCFGVLKRPGKEARPCRKRYMWGAVESNSQQFGRNGARACPRCGTLPDFKHPFNKFLAGDLTEQEAKKQMPGYLESLKKEEN